MPLPWRNVVMIHTREKNQGRRLRGLKVRVETNGHTDGRTRPNLMSSSLTWSVNILHNAVYIYTVSQ